MSTVCAAGARPDGASEIHVYDPETLTTAQRAGDACAVCHVKWPRPRRVIGVLPDGGRVRGCRDCADLVSAGTATREPAFAAH
ncbi:hypothetical protein [Nocardiopsis sp. LOL_012]|uniref:hypothetical protein n=1 Tax=Nocardiopsis sp. LOL_012 TaxID=3345409 RepID=UPI003A8BAD99